VRQRAEGHADIRVPIKVARPYRRPSRRDSLKLLRVCRGAPFSPARAESDGILSRSSAPFFRKPVPTRLGERRAKERSREHLREAIGGRHAVISHRWKRRVGAPDRVVGQPLIPRCACSLARLSSRDTRRINSAARHAAASAFNKSRA